jgi:hypothetical protein
MTKKNKYILYSGIKFAKEKLGVKTPFDIELTSKRTGDFKTYAYYDPEKKLIKVYIKGRGCADILRSVFHELVHHFDHENGRIKGKQPDVGKFDTKKMDGDDIENRANGIAGAMIKDFSYKFKDKENIDVYEF